MPIAEARQRLATGEILAIKGLGGFHLACDAFNAAVVERLRSRKRRSDKPFAIIQRWLIADINAPDKTGSPTTKPMLAVTRLPPGPVCHVAYIDGQVNRNPNELARQAADEFARDFKCGKDEVKVVGEKGAAVSLAKR